MLEGRQLTKVLRANEQSFARFERMRGKLNDAEYAGECRKLRDYLATENHPHLNEFLDAWGSSE